ncbi:hypothetical protein Lfu02_39920 [Longispora fulva]|uniref:Uncharacterized protein n=1 Tax=Longispora fulva TaxID=619741 RepID=A0A8J7GQV5_9ACTN|nr:hypothetical protein [Longispora fulva]MBG6136453.1 hypothetical protein [Longispora fulva]GIG59620.1 hypothetical protein Lfu02_39920 [Longispora fulva]
MTVGPAPLDRLLVRNVVRDVIAEAAPEELPLVNSLTQLDDATVVRQLLRGRRRREPLGFGVEEALALATPAVWLVLNEIAKKATDAAVDGSARGMRALLHKALRRRKALPAALPPLSREQLAEVQRQVLRAAIDAGVRQKRAVTVADVVVARLAMSVPDTTTPDDGPDDASSGVRKRQ